MVSYRLSEFLFVRSILHSNHCSIHNWVISLLSVVSIIYLFIYLFMFIGYHVYHGVLVDIREWPVEVVLLPWCGPKREKPNGQTWW